MSDFSPLALAPQRPGPFIAVHDGENVLVPVCQLPYMPEKVTIVFENTVLAPYSTSLTDTGERRWFMGVEYARMEMPESSKLFFEGLL